MALSRRFLLSALVLALAGTQIVLVAPSLAAQPQHFKTGTPGIVLSTSTPPAAERLTISDQRRSLLTVTNSGSDRGLYSLQIEPSGNRRLLQQLELTIAKQPKHGHGQQARPLFHGPPSNLGTLPLGHIQPGQQESLTLVIRLRPTGSTTTDTTLQTLTAQLHYRVTVTQQ